MVISEQTTNGWVAGPRGRRKPPPPDATYVTALKSWAETHYKDDDNQIDLMRKVRQLEDPPVIPEELKIAGVDTVLQDSTITDECWRVVATLAMRPPNCTVTPPDPETDLAQENSTDREHFTEELFKVCGSRTPGRDTFRMLMDACVCDGGAVVKWVYNPDRWESVYRKGIESSADPKIGENEKKARENLKKKQGPPMSRIAVDVRTWYPVWDGDRIVECLEVSERSTAQVMRQYDLSFDAANGFGERMGAPISPGEAERYPQTTTMLEHWDETYVTYVVANGKHSKEALQFEHGLGRVPYFFAPGLMMNHWQGRKVGWGVGMSKLSLVRFRAFLISLMIQPVARAAGAPLAHERPEAAEGVQGEEDAPWATVPVPLAGMIELGPGEKITDIRLPGIPDAAKEMLALVTRMVEDLNSPKPNAAIGGDLAGAGYAIQSVLTEGKTRHHPYISSLERMYEEETYFVWDMITNRIQETVWVRRSLGQGEPATPGKQWWGMGPDELDAAVGVRWSLDPEPATSKIVEERYVVEMLNAGLMSLDQGRAYLGMNPDEVRIGLVMDRLRNEGFYTKYVDEQLLRRLERGDIMRKAAEAVAETGVLAGMDPMLAARIGMGQPMAQPALAAPGGPIMPDQAALAASPNGQGAATVGGGGGPYVPSAGAQAGVMNMGS